MGRLEANTEPNKVPHTRSKQSRTKTPPGENTLLPPRHVDPSRRTNCPSRRTSQGINTPGPDRRNCSLDNRNGQTSRPGEITPHYAGSETAVTHPREENRPPGKAAHRNLPLHPPKSDMTPSSVELQRCSWEQLRRPGNGTEAGAPPQGTGILPKAVDKARAGARRHQQEGRSKRLVKRDPRSSHKDEEDATGNRRDRIPDGEEGDGQPGQRREHKQIRERRLYRSKAT